MSYVVPSVLVYQQLASSGGVANITPDLDACIIGPCFNVVKYDQSSSAALTISRALVSIGGASLSIVAGGADDAYLNSTKVGQLVDEDSIAVYVNKAQVDTKYGRFIGNPNSNLFNISAMSGFTVSTTANSRVITFDSAPTTLRLYDYLTITGTNVGGSGINTLESYVTAISGVTVTLFNPCRATLTGAPVSRTGVYNKNDLTSTVRFSVGDPIEVDLSVGTLFTSILSMTAVGDKVTSFRSVDPLPGTETPGNSHGITFRKVYNDLLIPEVFDTTTNYTTANAASDGFVHLNALMACVYGYVAYGDVHLEYKALRQDLSGSVLDIANPDDQLGVLGKATDENPLALGVQLALANTVGRIRCIAVLSDDLQGYLDALDLAENSRLYALAPLTQDIAVLTAVQQHVEQMSTPEFASWRIGFVNTEIPATQSIGPYNENLVNSGGTLALNAGQYYLTSTNSTFVSDGVVPGDILRTKLPSAHAYTITAVVSNQQIQVTGPTADLAGVTFWVERNLSKVQQAEVVAANSETFGSNRIVHVQPDQIGVTIDGVLKYLPGYYAAAALAGLASGLPAQKGMTNIGLAGISDLGHSNFYFTRAQLNTIAGAGTLILAQEAQKTIPYVRHSLTTDMTVLQYREVQQVKNIDFVSYYFHDILKGFPGRYNITPDTLQILRTTINAAGKLLEGKVLPKLGAPLLSFTIKTLKQDDANRDHVIIELPITIPTVMNYINLYLIV